MWNEEQRGGEDGWPLSMLGDDQGLWCFVVPVIHSAAEESELAIVDKAVSTWFMLQCEARHRLQSQLPEFDVTM